MKSFIVFALIVAAAVAAPAGPEADAVIVTQELNNIGVDGYSHQVETSNGISQGASAQLVDGGTENAYLVVSGRYAHTGPDGVVYSVSYVADQDGFKPEGAHLPKVQA